jgi:hypothetical protein
MVSADSGPAGFAIPPSLQQAWILQLHTDHAFYNWVYVRRRLSIPVIRIGSAADRLGEWNTAARTITIAERHVLSHPWESVRDTLRHEMAHQYVSEILGLPDAPPHGEPFREACRVLRVEPQATAGGQALGSLEASAAERDRILARVKDLLALATSPNEHEAASAMRMAHKYLLQYNLDLSAAAAPRHYERKHLGKLASRIQEHEYALAAILQRHFFVLVLWTSSYDALTARSGRILEILGTPENLEMAEYVYHYLRNVGEHLWRVQRAAPGWRGGTKLQYLAGLMRGFQEKLDAQARELKEERGLVWLGDAALKDRWKHLNPRVCAAGGYGVERGSGFEAGRADGRNLTIHRGIGGGAANRGKLLPGG